MRLRDKILIEEGYVTRAKVKWYGYGNFAHPYLWKTNKSDTDYRESWSNPKGEKKTEKAEEQWDMAKNIKVKRGRGM